VIARSYLYVPGDSGERLERLTRRSAADAVIADLEDAVAPARKPEAVEAIAARLAQRSENGVQRSVQINASRLGLDDLHAVFGPALDGIVIPAVLLSGRHTAPAIVGSTTPDSTPGRQPTTTCE